MAAALEKELEVATQIVNGDRGELSVAVDGRTVFRKGESLPATAEVVNAVREEIGVHAGK